jgi:outer membrane protein TolC
VIHGTAAVQLKEAGFMLRSRILCALLLAVAVLAPRTEAAPPLAGPLDVDEAVRLALRQNYSYRQAETGVASAEGSRMSALAGLLPSANGSVYYSKSDQTSAYQVTEINGIKVTSEDLPEDSQSNGTTAGFGLSENLSLPLWYRYRGTGASVAAARHGQAASAQELAFQVRQQFYMVLRAQGLLNVQTESLQLARDEERRVQSMFDLGSVAKVDVLKARVQVSEAELALIRQENQVAIERSRLATLMGFSADTPLTLAGDLSSAPAPVDSLGVAKEALVRPDIQQAISQRGSADNYAKAALLSRVPGLFARFSYSNSDVSASRSQFELINDKLEPYDIKAENQAHGWNVQVGASVTLDAFFNIGADKQARAAARQADYHIQDLKLAVQQEVEEAILNYRASIAAIETAQRGVEASQEDLRLSEQRYEQGLGTVLELLQSQVNLTTARNNLVNAQTGLKISEAALDKARGAELPE